MADSAQESLTNTTSENQFGGYVDAKDAGWVLAVVCSNGGTIKQADKVFEMLTCQPAPKTPSEAFKQVFSALTKVQKDNG